LNPLYQSINQPQATKNNAGTNSSREESNKHIITDEESSKESSIVIITNVMSFAFSISTVNQHITTRKNTMLTSTLSQMA